MLIKSYLNKAYFHLWHWNFSLVGVSTLLFLFLFLLFSFNFFFLNFLCHISPLLVLMHGDHQGTDTSGVACLFRWLKLLYFVYVHVWRLQHMENYHGIVIIGVNFNLFDWLLSGDFRYWYWIGSSLKSSFTNILLVSKFLWVMFVLMDLDEWFGFEPANPIPLFELEFYYWIWRVIFIVGFQMP